MSNKKVTFVELPVFSGILPLVSGYMEACCRKHPELVSAYQFEKISLTVGTPYEEVISTLIDSRADVYAFSTYVWNSGMVRRLVNALLEARPLAYIMLGGPQVIGQGMRYLSPQHENMFVCNGEGERTFPAFLLETLKSTPDFSTVRNLSFYQNQQLQTTEPESRITDLSEIPSPFLEGVFDNNQYTWMLIETNRGCPFKCNYCYWGSGAIGSRVYKYNDERLLKELAWISQSQCWYLFIADANWGMLKRDIDISKFIVDCYKANGAPQTVYFCGSKNTPDRVTEITQIFHQAGMMSTQAVSLQTMNPETLIRVNRDNIKTSAYTQIQQSLNERGISSFVELIWPLPGETLASFQEGLAKLCEIGANSFAVYPLILMNNVELAGKQKEYELVTISDPDPNSEAEIVVQTKEVDTNAYQDGQRYLYSVLSLYVLRGLRHLGRYLQTHGAMSWLQLFRSFVEFSKQRPAHPWTAFCEESIRNVTLSSIGALMHIILHSHREDFDDLLEQFFSAQDFRDDPQARLLFEADIINRPYVYSNTPIIAKRNHFEYLQVVKMEPNGCVVNIPAEYAEQLRDYLGYAHSQDMTGHTLAVNYKRSQFPFMRSKPLKENYLYCQDKSHRMADILPVWQEVAVSDAQ